MPASQISTLQNTFTTRSKFSCTCWCALGGEPRESPPPHTHSQVRKCGIPTWLSAASGNMPQKLMLGTSSEILLEVVCGNAVVSVNSVNRALLFPKPQEMVPF